MTDHPRYSDPQYASVPSSADALPATQAMPVPASPPAYVTGDAPRSPEPGQGMVDVAKEQASQVSDTAVEAGQHVVGVAKDQASVVADEASRQAKSLLAQARTELTQQADQQQRRIAEGLRALGEELHAMTEHDGQSGPATDLARQGSQKSRELASWLDQREPGHLVEEVKTFARQRPGSFLLLAAGLGLAAGRLTRGMKDGTGHAAPLSTTGSAERKLPPRAQTPVQTQTPTPTPTPTYGEYGSTTLSSDGYPAGGGI